jgi:hypothetical protein
VSRRYSDGIGIDWEPERQMNSLARLSQREVAIVRECLVAAIQGPFFPDWEFQTLIGLEREEVQTVLAHWPASPQSEAQLIAVTNVLSNLLSYPHGEWDVWSRYISADPQEVATLLERWSGFDATTDVARNYFGRML